MGHSALLCYNASADSVYRFTRQGFPEGAWEDWFHWSPDLLGFSGTLSFPCFLMWGRVRLLLQGVFSFVEVHVRNRVCVRTRAALL